MKAQNTVLQMATIIAESIFPKKKSSRIIEKTQEKEIHDCVTILKNGEHTALLPYNNKTVKNLLHAIKYENHRKSIGIASDILSEHIYEEIQEKEMMHTMRYVICTIPITKERKNKNGYDHMHLLLNKIQKRLTKNVSYENILQWTRKTQRQTGIKRKTERTKNMHQAMKAKKSIPKNTTCFIIDDITTTGATLTEAKRVLKQVGADTVITIALAH